MELLWRIYAWIIANLVVAWKAVMNLPSLAKIVSIHFLCCCPYLARLDGCYLGCHQLLHRQVWYCQSLGNCLPLDCCYEWPDAVSDFPLKGENSIAFITCVESYNEWLPLLWSLGRSQDTWRVSLWCGIACESPALRHIQTPSMKYFSI